MNVNYESVAIFVKDEKKIQYLEYVWKESCPLFILHSYLFQELYSMLCFFLTRKLIIICKNK